MLPPKKIMSCSKNHSLIKLAKQMWGDILRVSIMHDLKFHWDTIEDIREMIFKHKRLFLLSFNNYLKLNMCCMKFSP